MVSFPIGPDQARRDLWQGVEGGTLTLSAGEVTLPAVGSLFWVDTEGEAADDNLTIVNGGREGMMIALQQADPARTITVKHAFGNLLLADEQDVPLGNTSKMLVLVRRGLYWVQAAAGGGGGGIEVSENNAVYASNTTDTTIIATKTVSAGSMGLNGIVKAEVWVYYRQNTGAGRSLTYTFTFGSTTITETINIADWANEDKWVVRKFDFVVQNIGATNVQRMAALTSGCGADIAGALGITLAGLSGFQEAAEDSTGALTMKIELQMSVASPDFEIKTLGARFFGP
jgi:hypothetical protein